jgi:ubiquinone/menaquinone biosynthesis C-methylase UbiE
MAATYGIVNLISSFGFAARWRHQLVDDLLLANASHVVDLMSGMNELCRSIAPHVAPAGLARPGRFKSRYSSPTFSPGTLSRPVQTR